MRLTKLMLVAAIASWCVVALFLAGCRTQVPLVQPIYGSASDTYDPGLPPPAVLRTSPASAAVVQRPTPAPAPVVPCLPKSNTCGAYG